MPSRICAMLENVFPTPGFLKYSLMFSFNTSDFIFLYLNIDPPIIYFEITRGRGDSVLIFHLNNCDAK